MMLSTGRIVYRGGPSVADLVIFNVHENLRDAASRNYVIS